MLHPGYKRSSAEFSATDLVRRAVGADHVHRFYAADIIPRLHRLTVPRRSLPARRRAA